MSEDIASKGVEVITLPDGSIRCGDVIHEPWPSLRTLPHRSLGFRDEIVRATPGSPFYEFASRIPTEIRASVRAAPSYSWSLLELCAVNPGRGLDLLKTCPALAVLVVRNYSPTDQCDRRDYFRTMLALPWRDLLRGLRLPPRERTMRILGKVPLAHSNKQVLGTPGHPWVHVLPHLPRITRDTISILSSDSKIINAALLRASAETSFDEETVHWLIGSVRALLIENGREGDWPYRNATFAQLKIAGLNLFQLSVHRRSHVGADLVHLEWLNTERASPNRRFLSALRSMIGDHGTTLVWTAHEEKSFNTLLAELIGEGEDDDDGDLRWLKIYLKSGRIVDQCQMCFRHYISPLMMGRTSLKVVLPAIWSEVSPVKARAPCAKFPEGTDPYAVLKAAGKIHEGCGAMTAYLEMQASDGEVRVKLIRELLEY